MAVDSTASATPPPASARRAYYRLAPSFVEELLPRLDRRRALLLFGEGQTELVDGIDGAELIHGGCVRDWGWHDAHLVAVVELLPLVAQRRERELARCIEAVARRGAPGIALLNAALAGLEPAAAVLLLVALGDGVTARRRVAALAGPGDALSICTAARCHGLLLDDLDEARRLLESLDQGHEGPGQLHAAEGWLALFTDEERARRAILRAEETAVVAGADGALLRVQCAYAFQRLLADGEAGRRCLAAAPAANPSPSVLRAAAEAWASLFPSDPAGRRLVDQAAQSARSGVELAECASVLKDVFADEPAARRVVEAAEAQGAFLFAARVWRDSFGDRAAAARCLGEAEARADERSDALGRVAEAWRDLLGAPDEARRCLTAAEGRAQTPSAWASCAVAWQRAFADPGEIKRCLGEMEKRSHDVVEWAACSRVWRELAQLEAEARRCLAEGESRAATVEDRLRAAAAWREIGGDLDAARRCLDGAAAAARQVHEHVAAATAFRRLVDDEGAGRATLAATAARAVRSLELVAIAEAWQQAFADHDAARACLRDAEERAIEPRDLLTVADGWERLLSDGETGRRLRVRELEQRAGEDLSILAEGWRRLFGDDQGPRLRLRQRERGALGVADWERLAEQWRDVFAAADEEARCRGEADRLRAVEAAMVAGDWPAYAKGLRDVLGDLDEAKRRLADLESTRAAHLADYILFARAWKGSLDDDEQARRCMKAAAALIRFKSDWKLCAEGWRQIGDYAEAQRCSDMAYR